MQEENFHLTVNDKTELDLAGASVATLDAVQTEAGKFHILQNGKAYRAEVVSLDFAAKEVRLKVNGNLHEVKIQDSFDRRVKKMGLKSNVAHKISAIKAPMPGLVLSVLVEPGQEVVHGDPLLILEAMKMENVIKSPGEGTVKLVLVTKGKPVDKGEVLIELA
ncbi:MAG: biotin/lipoyl-binding protein [Bacteroidetes bacterium]|nr:biotin/lipoyl-binding protein [Bacteroidota bacterium]